MPPTEFPSALRSMESLSHQGVGSSCSSDAVRVAVRVRPQLAREKIDNDPICVSRPDPSVPTIQIGTNKMFTFDYVFDPDSQQEEVYSSIAKPLIEGYVSVFVTFLSA